MSSTPHAALGRKRVTMTGVLAQSIGFMGPVFSVATLLPLIVGLSATGRGAAAAKMLAQQGWAVVINYTKSKAEAEAT